MKGVRMKGVCIKGAKNLGNQIVDGSEIKIKKNYFSLQRPKTKNCELEFSTKSKLALEATERKI